MSDPNLQQKKSGPDGGVIASLVGVGLLLVLMVQNTQPVTVHILLWKFTWALWLYGLLMAVIGALIWFGLGVMRRHSRRKARRDKR
jgi:uncharacterized integral membrane protein